MFRSRECTEKAPEHDLEASLGILRREIGHRLLLADNESQLWDQVHHELAVRSECLKQ